MTSIILSVAVVAIVLAIGAYCVHLFIELARVNKEIFDSEPDEELRWLIHG